MKRKTLQMLRGIDKNVEKVHLVVNYLAREVERRLGKQVRGRKRMPIKQAIAGILYYTRFGCGWMNLPASYGRGKTVYHWFRIFVDLGLAETVWQSFVKKLEQEGKLQLANVSIDGSLVQMTNGENWRSIIHETTERKVLIVWL